MECIEALEDGGEERIAAALASAVGSSVVVVLEGYGHMFEIDGDLREDGGEFSVQVAGVFGSSSVSFLPCHVDSLGPHRGSGRMEIVL